ncbi:MAG: hypothetical protein JST79_05490 [Acidobacteria bacterium]|jgi:hypothetical protein|nr:hypothetical protein [Acidobacteriota bacterium]
MLSKCANPDCSERFLYMRDGKLFRFDPPDHQPGMPEFSGTGKKAPGRTEYFWLCRNCATVLTLISIKGLGVVPRPLRQAKAAAS